ncbi:MSCRAMM family protein [Oceanirhabdus sp. W0125-5]|uniref:MSCRAMM family protein n=1 Tax=Oceanirhabdus sp. W0125-5 TaxID=2999116 RepID=UPI0022F2C303|nr:carboxypeptidase regulatory-like domain-containing protein [Oceanirhabdus sp. W0125-5]WBW97736.1 carboxypeptidase regulatory-like domain-containing protein [Oceanirhabdus sp. W0125-5]
MDNPIAGALVKIMDNNHNPLAHAITGEDGAYIFNSFPPGSNYHIYAIAQGYKLEEDVPFTLLPQQSVEKDFILPIDPASALAIIAGDILDIKSQKAINGAVVNLFNEVDELIALSYTNEYGQFVFADITKGKYTVRFSALGYKPSSQTVEIDKDGQIANIVVNLDEDPSSARGTVSGMITDNNNEPIDGAEVILYSVGADETLTPIAFTKTTDEGVYLFINVAKGDYKIKANQEIIEV